MKGKPQGGAKSEAGRAAYWRMNYESAIGVLADLIAEHTQTVEELENLRTQINTAVCSLCGIELWTQGHTEGVSGVGELNRAVAQHRQRHYLRGTGMLS